MNDDELIDKVATMWISNGGDAEGFAWLTKRIFLAIKRSEIVDGPEDEQRGESGKWRNNASHRP